MQNDFFFFWGVFQGWGETKWMVGFVCKEREFKKSRNWYFNEIKCIIEKSDVDALKNS